MAADPHQRLAARCRGAGAVESLNTQRSGFSGVQSAFGLHSHARHQSKNPRFISDSEDSLLYLVPEMNRTPDLLITNELLYRLSYTGDKPAIIAGVAGHAVNLVLWSPGTRGHALVQFGDGHVQNALLAIGGGTTGTPPAGPLGWLRTSGAACRLFGFALVPGYMNTPPRVMMRWTSATMLATQRMLKSLPRTPSLPSRRSPM